MLIAISDATDPSRKRRKFLDDVGMIWFGDDRISFRGDVTFFDITHEQLIGMDRLADRQDVAAYFGAIHIILHFKNPDGSIRDFRLHPSGNLLVTSDSAALDRLATRIESWRQQLPVSIGFPVQVATP
jgi:hypothetical protein